MTTAAKDLGEPVRAAASLCVALWMPLAVVWAHSFVQPLPGLGRAAFLAMALLGVWALKAERQAPPLLLAFLVYGGVLRFLGHAVADALGQFRAWAWVLCTGEAVVLVGALVDRLVPPER